MYKIPEKFIRNMKKLNKYVAVLAGSLKHTNTHLKYVFFTEKWPFWNILGA
jgi:hypothetical protein